MPHIFSAGFARRSIFRLSRIPQLCVLSLTIAVGLASTVHVPLASAQRARASRNQRTNDQMPPKAAAPVAAAPVTPEPPVAPPPIAVTVEQTPPQLPVISWDGVQLTIDAENSTLSDIMLGIRGRTGASIEMPPSASRERVAVHLGPAPIREVLSSLLYGSDFDYIVQGSDTDPNGLRRVILTTRGGNDDTVVAGGAEKVPGMRLMPGYVAPGKHDFEVSQKIGDDDAISASASESAQPAPEAGTTTADAASANAQPPADAGTQTPAVDSADVTMPIGGESPGGNRTTASTSLDQSGSGDPSSMSQMQQNLQRMYQQRQKIQAQQNQSALPPTH